MPGNPEVRVIGLPVLAQSFTQQFQYVSAQIMSRVENWGEPLSSRLWSQLVGPNEKRRYVCYIQNTPLLQLLPFRPHSPPTGLQTRIPQNLAGVNRITPSRMCWLWEWVLGTGTGVFVVGGGQSRSDWRASEVIPAKWLWEGTGRALGRFCRPLPTSMPLGINTSSWSQVWPLSPVRAR